MMVNPEPLFQLIQKCLKIHFELVNRINSNKKQWILNRHRTRQMFKNDFPTHKVTLILYLNALTKSFVSQKRLCFHFQNASKTKLFHRVRLMGWPVFNTGMWNVIPGNSQTRIDVLFRAADSFVSLSPRHFSISGPRSGHCWLYIHISGASLYRSWPHPTGLGPIPSPGWMLNLLFSSVKNILTSVKFSKAYLILTCNNEFT